MSLMEARLVLVSGYGRVGGVVSMKDEVGGRWLMLLL